MKNDAIGSMGIAPYQEVANEDYMNEKQLAHIEKILLAWRQSLMEEVDRTLHHMQDDCFGGLGDALAKGHIFHLAEACFDALLMDACCSACAFG